jgi:hypothetical protein
LIHADLGVLRDWGSFGLRAAPLTFLRKYVEDLAALGFGNIRIVNECVHTTADSKTLWITHGDLYDVVYVITGGSRTWAIGGMTSCSGSIATLTGCECASRGYDGVVCGHIHKAVMKTVGGVLYCNDGDWVESGTALVEHDDGRLEIIQWHIVSHEGAEAASATAVVDSTAEGSAATHKNYFK